MPEEKPICRAVKILTTGMGEATSAFLAPNIYPAVVVLVGFVGRVATLALQLAAPRYNAWSHRLAAVMVSVFGIMAADVLQVSFGVPCIVSTTFFAVSPTAAAIIEGWLARLFLAHRLHLAR